MIIERWIADADNLVICTDCRDRISAVAETYGWSQVLPEELNEFHATFKITMPCDLCDWQGVA